jgi:hypothetical protein
VREWQVPFHRHSARRSRTPLPDRTPTDPKAAGYAIRPWRNRQVLTTGR